MGKNIVSTLETPGLTFKRADGNTSRQVDFAVQKLFEGREVLCIDHYYPFHNISKINLELIKRIKARLENEHQIKSRGFKLIEKPKSFSLQLIRGY